MRALRTRSRSSHETGFAVTCCGSPPPGGDFTENATSQERHRITSVPSHPRTIMRSVSKLLLWGGQLAPQGIVRLVKRLL
jgi:hypothetical protein